MRVFLVLGFILLILGCKKNVESEKKYTYTTISKTSKGFVIPRELRAIIDQNYMNFVRSKNPKLVLNDEDLLAKVPREFLDIRVKLHAESSSVLKKNVIFELPRGGGEIDVNQYVTGLKGSFFIEFELKQSNNKEVVNTDYDVFFFSEAKSRKIGKENYGAGCNTFMDVSQIIKKSNSESGLKLNVTDQRYLSVIGGVFYFIHYHENRKIFLAAVRITDSRYPELLCEEK